MCWRVVGGKRRTAAINPNPKHASPSTDPQTFDAPRTSTWSPLAPPVRVSVRRPVVVCQSSREVTLVPDGLCVGSRQSCAVVAVVRCMCGDGS